MNAPAGGACRLMTMLGCVRVDRLTPALSPDAGGEGVSAAPARGEAVALLPLARAGEQPG
jgi:hypothetical protein